MRGGGRNSVDIGTNLHYAAIHQFGGTIQPKAGGALTFMLATGQMILVGAVTMPARPYLGISTDDEEQIREFVEIHFGMDAA
ncbi:MAG: phage virion morphogenesis protein [Paracoccus sp. (in: a-proteobacteria)]|nr:phage virion morphogenesis protein [Paracoccus sp. (in: a-proteobacteria)]